MTRPMFNRPDTLLGVCEALGEDLGFNPLWLRVALAVGVLWNPWAMIAAYLGLAAAIGVARWLTPARRPAAPPAAAVAEPVGNDDGVILWAEAA